MMHRNPCWALALALFLAPGTLADEKKEPPPPARVVVVGQGESYLRFSNAQIEIQAGEDVQKKLAEARKQIQALSFKLDDKSGLLVAFPANVFQLQDIRPAMHAAVAIEGILATTDNEFLIVSSGNKGAKRAPL